MFIFRFFLRFLGGFGFLVMVYAIYVFDSTKKDAELFNNNADFERSILCIGYGRSESSIGVDMDFCRSIFTEKKVLKDGIHPDEYGYMPGLKKEEKDSIRRLYVAISAQHSELEKSIPDFDKWWEQLPLRNQ